MNIITHRYCPLILVIITSLLALLSSLCLDRQLLFSLVGEWGAIENLTLVGYFFAIFFTIFYPDLNIRRSSRLSLIILMTVMLAREADLHKVFGMSMLKIKFWLTNEPLLTHKLIATVILLLVIFTFYILLRRYAKTWLHDLKSGQNYAFTIVIFFIAFIVSKVIDRSVNFFYEIAIWQAPNWLISIQLPQEEYLECSLPLLIIIAIIQYCHDKPLT